MIERKTICERKIHMEAVKMSGVSEEQIMDMTYSDIAKRMFNDYSNDIGKTFVVTLSEKMEDGDIKRIILTREEVIQDE